MKLPRLLSVLLALLLLAAGLLATGCSAAPQNNQEAMSAPEYTGLEPPASGADIALVATDETLQGDFAQSALAAINRYAGEMGLTAGVYPAEGGEEAVRANMELAVKGGAEMVLVVGSGLAAAAGDFQAQYPDIKFILLGMGPDTTVLDNAVRVVFSPEHGGWLAGYAAVLEGYGAIGWMGTGEGSEARQQAALRGGLGFLLGAEAAARDLGLEPGSVVALSPPLLPTDGGDSAGGGSAPESGAPEEDPAGKSVPESGPVSAGSTADAADASAIGGDAGALGEAATQLYGMGAAVVFANLPDSQAAVQAAAQATGGGVIGYSLYGGAEGNILNIKYDPTDIITSLLDSWQAERFHGGGVALATVANGGIGLDMAGKGLEKLTEGQYEGMLEAVRFGTLDTDISQALSALALGNPPAPESLPLTVVRLNPGPPDDSSSPE